MNCVGRLVLVVLSLWPHRAVAPGPPPGPPRASPDPRAELDSTVLLTRSLLADTRQLTAQLKDKFPAEGDHNLDSLPTLAMSAGALGALQLPGVLTRLRADLLSYLRHVQWLRRAGGTSLKTLEPELGALQARLDRLLRRLQLLMSRLALPQAPPDPPAPPGSARLGLGRHQGGPRHPRRAAPDPGLGRARAAAAEDPAVTGPGAASCFEARSYLFIYFGTGRGG